MRKTSKIVQASLFSWPGVEAEEATCKEGVTLNKETDSLEIQVLLHALTAIRKAIKSFNVLKQKEMNFGKDQQEGGVLHQVPKFEDQDQIQEALQSNQEEK